MRQVAQIHRFDRAAIGKVHFPLTHFNGDTFYFVTKGEMQSGTAAQCFKEISDAASIP